MPPPIRIGHAEPDPTQAARRMGRSYTTTGSGPFETTGSPYSCAPTSPTRLVGENVMLHRDAHLLEGPRGVAASTTQPHQHETQDILSGGSPGSEAMRGASRERLKNSPQAPTECAT